jgi:hypothetical protein
MIYLAIALFLTIAIESNRKEEDYFLEIYKEVTRQNEVGNL